MKLQVLLVQLARYLNDNETIISANEVSNCYRHLSTIETSALNRLFLLLHQENNADLSATQEATDDHQSPLTRVETVDSPYQVGGNSISPSTLLLADATASGNIASDQNRPSIDTNVSEHALPLQQSVAAPITDFEESNQAGSQQCQLSVTASTAETFQPSRNLRISSWKRSGIVPLSTTKRRILAGRATNQSTRP